MAPEEGSLRPGAGWNAMERGVKWSHGEREIRINVQGSSDLRQEFLEGSRFRPCSILGGRLRNDRPCEGARKPSEEWMRSTASLWSRSYVCSAWNAPAGTISTTQEVFIDSILARFNLFNASTVLTPLAPELDSTQPTVPRRRTERRRWPHALAESSLAHLHGFHLALGRTSHLPPARSPALRTTPAVFIGQRPSMSYTTSREPKHGVSSWMARPR